MNRFCRADYLAIGSGNDHRYINGLVDFGDEDETSYGYQSNKMRKIMSRAGLIRLIPESNTFHIIAEVTKEQRRAIIKYIKEYDYANVEFGDVKANKYTEDNLHELEEDLDTFRGIKLSFFKKEARNIGEVLDKQPRSILHQ